MEIRDVEKLAELARIEIPDEEKAEFVKNLGSILGYVDIIKNAAVEGIKPEVGELRNVAREDEARDFDDRQKLISAFPDSDGDYLKVKKIL